MRADGPNFDVGELKWGRFGVNIKFYGLTITPYSGHLGDCLLVADANRRGV